MYEYADESQIPAMDDWEDVLTNDLYDVEEMVENFLQSISEPKPANTMSLTSEQTSEQSSTENSSSSIDAGGSNEEINNTAPGQSTVEVSQPQPETNSETNEIMPKTSLDISEPKGAQNTVSKVATQSLEHLTAGGTSKSKANYNLSSPQPFDSWIDDLSEFTETTITANDSEMSIAEALYKLEASKDIPTIKLMKYDGSPLTYVEFIDRFKLLIHDRPHLSDDVRMAQLKMHLVGRAERVVSGLGSQGTMYATALKTIKEYFGQPSIIARAYITKLVDNQKIQANDRQSLQELSFDVINCVAVLKQINHLADVNATENLRKIITRLPDHLIDKWKGVVSDLRERGETPSLQHIGQFIRKRVKAEFDPDFGDIQKSDKRRPLRGIHSGQRDAKKPLKCYVCSEEHRVVECPTFSGCTIEQKVQRVRDQRLCFSCLNRGHVTKDCKSKVKCDVNGCSRFHHHLLHQDPPPPPTSRLSSATSALDKESIMPVVRVRFRSKNGNIREGNVLIDSGAGTTVIRKDFANALGLQGRKERIDIAVVGGERITQDDSRRVKFWISPLHGDAAYPVEAHELDQTIINVPALNRDWLKSFDHLGDIEFPHSSGPVDLILGVQYSHFHAENEVRQGLPFQPVAKRTKLGWHVIGPDNVNSSTSTYLNFVKKIDLEKFYEFETLGVRAPECNCPEETMTRDGRKTMELFESSCRKLDGRYEIGLPWKKDPVKLPNNFSLAKQRLESLERSLSRNPDKATRYSNAIREYETNGWARKLSETERKNIEGPVYYLPHHGVYRPDKKSTPLRIVFDPACLYKGISLNSFLHKGPCLIGNLLGVLLRFLEEAVAFAGDISKMFLQIRLPASDCQVHRFLWREMETTREPTTYALLRVTFGDKPSPDMASFVMLKMAKEHENSAPEASKIIERDRYVDDLIHSCPSVSDGLQRIEDIDKILETGGFRIKEWHCSSKKLHESLNREGRPSSSQPPDSPSASNVPEPVGDRSDTNQVHLDGEQGVKTLGVSWNPNTDTINFQVKISEKEIYTKRSILSNISRLFDPLGLASVVTIKARIALQGIWKMKKFGWDDPLPKEMQLAWRKLFAEIANLNTVQFPRCLQPPSVHGSPELHVFADASVLAYGAAAYLVWSTSTGREVRLVSAKARVAPLRQTTVPRLELMAALIATRLAKTICNEFKIKPACVVLWSDSMIVLAWLRSESTMLKSFVGVRVAEIQASWEPGVWRYVPTNLNPADDLSRGISVREMNGRWMNGPPFLTKHSDEWPAETDQRTPKMAEMPEVKINRPLFALQPVVISTIIDPSRFSSWQRLCRVTAYCLCFINNARVRRVRDPPLPRETESAENTRAQRDHGPLSPREIESAEHYWIKTTQSNLTDWKDRYKDLAPYSKDGIVRNVEVKTKTGVYKRSVQKCCTILEEESS